jgi:tetratricopeptide (TPR) repeat protein
MIRLDPNNWAGYYARGISYVDTGKFDHAVADFETAMRLAPKRWEPYYGRGRAYLAKGDHQRAMPDFNEAIRLDPTEASAYYGRAGVQRAIGDHGAALTDLNEDRMSLFLLRRLALDASARVTRMGRAEPQARRASRGQS